ncbi:conserved hypothetical protein [Sphingomonas aurantiaca]|uniref:Uncharacterized protein n=1 Tax=Sphingomonas aurantiaca TaxID=185949 RepID=A0A5E7YLX9_9SPHN|nr:hypothetical protein [Sphingomonas aurantiaca]VVT07322.1 conserved hypothetical protein [Sphingomonas aurantiaca]
MPAGDDGESFKTAYLVRLRADQIHPREFVGLFITDNIGQLIDYVDDCCPVDACEYVVLPSGGLSQPGRSSIVPEPDDEKEVDLFRGATISDRWLDDYFQAPDNLIWTPLAPDNANDRG